MKTLFKRTTNSMIVLSVLAILLGIAMIVYPDVSLTALGYAVAAYLIVQGITLIVVDVKAWRMFIPFDGFLPGVLCILLGVLLAKTPEALAVYIGVFVGLWVIVSGFSGVKFANLLRKLGAPWLLPVLAYAAEIILGCLMLFSPVLSSLSLTVALGIILIAHAVVNLVTVISVKQNVRDVEAFFSGLKR